MIEYLLLILLVFAIAINYKNDKYNVFLFFSMILLALFSGFREVGSSPDDYNYYYSIYYRYFEFEKLYTLTEKFNVTFFNGDINTHFFIISSLSMAILFIALTKNKSIALWSLLVYMCHIYLYRDMIQIRAAVSYNLVLLSFVIINNRADKYFLFKYIFVYLAAVGFHFSSVLSICAIFLTRISISLKKYFFLLSLSFVFSLVVGDLILIFLSSFFPGVFTGYLNAYVLDDGGFTYSLGYLNPTTIKGVLFSIIFIKFRDDLLDFFGSHLFVNLYTISSFILIALSDFAVLASRIASLLSCVEILLVPATVLSAKSSNKLLGCIFIIIYIIMLLLNLIQKGMLDNYGFYLL